MTLTLQNKKKKIAEPFVVSTADEIQEPNVSGINLDEIRNEETKKLEANVEDKKKIADSLSSQINEKAPILDGIDLDSIKSKPVQELPSQQPDLSGIDLSSLGKSNPEAVLTQVAPGVISSKNLWNGAKEEDLAKIEYDDFNNLSYEEKFKLAAYQHNHPNPKGIPNPKRLLRAEPLLISGQKEVYPKADELLSAYLEKGAPNLLPFLQNFRAETGRSFAVSYGKTGRFENGIWEVGYQPTEALIRTLNAYAKGGMEEYNNESKKIAQENIIYEDSKKSTEKAIDEFQKDRSWFSSSLFGFKTGLVDETAGSSLQKLHNYEYLGKALYTSVLYGFNSDEYKNLIEEDKRGQTALNEGMNYIRHPEGGIGKFAEGTGAALGQLPYMQAGGQALPVFVYLENLHRGNLTAAGEAFKQLPFIATGGLVGGKLAGSIIAKETETGLFDVLGRIERQILTRSAQAGASTATDLWTNQKEYALGTKSISDIIPEAAVAALFPVGGVGRGHFNLSTRLESIKAQTSERLALPPALGELSTSEAINLNQESTQGTVKLPLDLLALNLLEMRRSLESKSYQRDKAFSSIQENIKRRANLEKGINILEKVVPKEVVDFVSQHENPIREAMQRGFRVNEAKETIRNSKDISEVDKVNTTNTNLDFLSQGRELFGEVGKSNKFTNQGQAAKDIANVKADFKDTTSTSNLNDVTSVLAYITRNTPRMARLGAFYIEAGVRDFSEFANRIKGDLGEELSGIFGEKRIQKLFEDGRKYYETNNADPFFSSFKQNVVERFPDKPLNAQSAWALLQRLGNKNELEWTQGLSKFVQDSIDGNKNITKKQILDIVQKGQVKFDEVILGDTKISFEDYVKSKGYKSLEDLRSATEQQQDLIDESWNKLNENNINKPTRYDLKTYTSEKLELEGGENPKEVLLIAKPEAQHINRLFIVPEHYGKWGYVRYRVAEYGDDGKFLKYVDNNFPFATKKVANNYAIQYRDKHMVSNYKHTHWSPYKNIVVHFRANFRTLVDGTTKVFHSEEFQSDWNQAGRKEGYKLSPIELKIRAELLVRKQAEPYNSNLKFHIKDEEGLNAFGATKEEAVNQYIERADKYYNKERDYVPRNPFMENSWKELAFKRFLRMGIEDGADGVTWTTSRQQQERYRKAYEGKTILWKRNGDNFDIGLRESTGEDRIIEENISLDRVKQLTNDEVANRIKERDYLANGEIDLKDTIQINKGYSDYDTYFVNLAKKIASKFGGKELYKIKEIETSEAKEKPAAMLVPFSNSRTGENGFAWETLGEKKLSQDFKTREEAIVNKPEGNYFYIDDAHKSIEELNQKRVEQVHYLEITPSMRESILKKGQLLYGLEMESLSKSQEKSGIRNRIVNLDEHSQILSELGEALNTESNSTGEVFNSGLNPEAFAQQVKLLYKGIRDFDEFSNTLITRFGETINPYVGKLWQYINAEPIDNNNILKNYAEENDLITTNIKDALAMLPDGTMVSKDKDKNHAKLFEAINVSTIHEFNMRTGAVRFVYAQDMLSNSQGSISVEFSRPLTEIQYKKIYNTALELGGLSIDVIDANKNIKFSSRLHDSDRITLAKTLRNANDIAKKENSKWEFNWREEITPEAQEIINRKLENGEAGRFSLRRERAQSFEEFKERNFRDKIRMLGYAVARGQTLAYFIPEFRQMYNRMREVRLQLEGYNTGLIKNLHEAYKNADDLNKVAEAIYSGNIEIDPNTGNRGLIYTDAELQSGTSRFGNTIPQLSTKDISAYKTIRQSQDAILRIRESQQIYKLQKTLSQQTVGSPEYVSTQDKINKIIQHYDNLRQSGYVSLQRMGKYAIYAEDTNFPVGDIRRKIYTHAKSEAEANKIALEYQRNGYTFPEIKLIRNNFKNVGELAKKLTPSQLEDLLHSSSANLNSPEVQKIRDEVLSNYSSFGYQLKRDFTRGYKPTWNNLKDTLHHQLEVYSSSYYNNIAREEGMDRLNAAELLKYSITSKDSSENNMTQLFDSKSEAEKYKQGLVGHADIKLQYPNEPLYHTIKSYIEDETSSPNTNGIIGTVNRAAINARQLTYIYNLGLDASQLLIQSTQPFVTTYPHLAKEVLTGLKGVQPEKVFIKSITATELILKEGLLNNTLRRQNPKQSKALNLLFGTANANEFRQLFQKAREEDVVAAEFAKSLAENELNVGSTLSRITNKASIISRKAELLNRTNAFTAGFLAGKEKGLSGNDLYTFSVDFVKNTQGEYSRGENPRIVRAFGEVGKLLYQFESYTQIWFENLATAVHSDIKTSSHKILHGATIRHLGALGVIAGFSGYPLANLARGLVTAMMQKDEKKNVEKQLEENLQYYLSLNPKSAESLKNLALYGASGNAGISERFGMEFPLLDNADKIITGDMDYSRSLPALSTGRQIVSGVGDLIIGEDRTRAIEDISPRFAKNPLRAYRYYSKGARDREGDTIVPRGRISTIENALTILGFQPQEIVRKRQDERFKKLQTFARNNSKKIRRNFNLDF